MNKYIFYLLYLNFIFAFYKQDPIMIATSGSYNTIAKGYQSVSVNPANIAFDEGLSINLFNVNYNFNNNFLTDDRLDDINGANLDDPNADKYFPKEDIIGYLEGDPVIFSMMTSFPLPSINFSKNQFAINTGVVYYSNLELSPDILDMVLYGNQINPNGIGREYDLTINKEDIIVFETSFTKAFNLDPIGIGFTIKYLKGLCYYNIKPIKDSYIQTNITGLGAQGQYLVNQNTRGSGLSLDFGITTMRNINGWKFGFSFINLFGNIKWNKESFLDDSFSGFYDVLPYDENEYFLMNLNIDNLNLNILNDINTSDIFQTDGVIVYEVDKLPAGIINEDYFCMDDNCETFLVPAKDAKKNDIVKRNEIRTDYPTYMSIGSSKLIDTNEFISFDLDLGLDNSFSNKEKWRLSFGYIFGTEKFPIRLGMSYGGYDQKSLGIGCGLNLGMFNFDIGIGYNSAFNIEKSEGLDFGINMYLMNL